MTTPQTARVLALIAAGQAKVAAMQTANAREAAEGKPARYSADYFFHVAEELEHLAQEVIQQ